MGGDKSGSEGGGGGWSGALSGAGKGAAAGSMFGPWGTLIGAGVGALTESGAADSILGTNGQAKSVGSLGMTGMGMANGAGQAMQGANSIQTPAADATKGFSGITSYGDTAKDVGGTNAWGQALGTGKGVPTVPTENGYEKLGKALTGAMDTAGSVMKMPEETNNANTLQAMQMTQSPQMSAPMNLSQVLAAQLMNPASQNRLAFQHPGRM